jgi:exodeoxyribonuclease-5
MFNIERKSLENAIKLNLGFEPTSDQQVAIDLFSDFFLSDRKLEMLILSGYAGTGKSSLVASIVKSLKQHKIKTKLLAPTGRAAKVLSNFAKEPAMTIHKQIYFSGNEVVGQKVTLAKNLHKNTLFFVDEASMIGGIDTNEGFNLLEDLLNYVYQGENCKLVIMGDIGQLPPVGQIDSPALSQEYLSQNYPKLNVKLCKLTQVVRLKTNSSVLENATHIRMLEDYEVPLITKTDGRETIRLNGLELKEQLESSYDQVGSEETILLTLSNKRANLWNNEIRNRILLREELLERGDVLMVVKNNYYWLDPLSEIGFIANGELVSVKRVLKSETLYGFNFTHLDISFLDYPDAPDLRIIVLTDSIQVEAPSLPREKMKELFFAVEQDYLHEKNKQKRYQLILKNPYFNAVQIKYAYAVTVHKAQGGQWEHVYIDYGFIPDELKNKNYLKWLYTSMTRSKEKLFLLNFPDELFIDENL